MLYHGSTKENNFFFFRLTLHQSGSLNDLAKGYCIKYC
nr:MAG TPA: hypothetical protein [Microviridae sp.]